MLLTGSIILAGAAGVGVLSLLWIYVPPHLRHFAEVGATLPLATRLAIATSNWVVRLLPALVVLGVPAFALTLGVLLSLTRDVPSRRMAAVATVFFFVLAAAQFSVCVFIVYGIRAAY